MLAILAAVPGPSQAEADCSTRGIASARAAFQAAYDARDYAGARTIIELLWNGCASARPRGPPILRAAIANDYALVAHRLDESALCLDLLMDYAGPAGAGDAARARLPAGLRRAIDHNIGLCRVRACASRMDANCASLRVVEQRAALSSARYRATPCAFAVSGAVATLDLPAAGRDRRCLALLSPRQVPSDLGARAEGDPDEICPRPVLARRGADGSVRADPLALPEQGFLSDTGLCCMDVSLARAPDGRIAIRPVDNPPEHCLTGHRADVLEDIVVLRGSRLVLRQSHGWRDTGVRR